MCHIVLFSPILALPLFLFLPFRTALPAYLAVVLATAFVYFKIIAAMKSKVRTGIEGMAEGGAVVVEEVAPEGKVRFKNELWAATSSEKRFFKGERVRINGLQGLKLIVGDPTEVRREGSCGSVAGE